MNINKITLILLLAACSIVIIGSTCGANSTNERLVEDFAKALQHANVYRETVLSETGEPVEIVLTVYEQPVVIDYFYNSIDEVDFSTPEGVFLSNLSAFTVDWYDANSDTTTGDLRNQVAEGLLRLQLWLETRKADYVVGKIELTYNQTEYVMFKMFREFESYDDYIVHTLVKTDNRWKKTPIHPETVVGYLSGLFTNFKAPVFADMIMGRYYSPITEIQQVYEESFRSGIFEPRVLSHWLRSVLWDEEVNINLAEVLSTYYHEEFNLEPNNLLSSQDNSQYWKWRESVSKAQEQRLKEVEQIGRE